MARQELNMRPVVAFYDVNNRTPADSEFFGEIKITSARSAQSADLYNFLFIQ